MNWHDGLIVIWKLHGYGKPKLNFIFLLLMLTLDGIGRGKGNLPCISSHNS